MTIRVRGGTGVLARALVATTSQLKASILLPGHAQLLAPRLHRLDARLGLRPDVPDALLRLMARRRGAQVHLLYVVAVGRHTTCTAISVPCRNLVRADHRQAPAEECSGRPDRAHDDSPRRRDLRSRFALSHAGILHRISVGAVDGSAARGCSEYHRSLDDADGDRVLDRFAEHSFGSGAQYAVASKVDRSGDIHCCRDFHGHAVAVDHVASALASLAA